MREFLIKRVDGDWFDLAKHQFPQAFVPASYPARAIEGGGDYRIKIGDCEISFSYEDPGIQVSFEKGNGFSESESLEIAGEIADQITRVTGQPSRVIEIGFSG